jgi:hypothetical protein
MKSSSCHDPKMEAYCEEVRHLEDKFHGLETTTLHAGIMRPPMNSQKSLLVELRSHLTFSQEISINRLPTSGQTEGSMGRHSIPHLRWKPPRPGLKPCRWKARPHQPTPSLTGVFCTSTISLEGTSPQIRSRLDGLLTGPNPL